MTYWLDIFTGTTWDEFLAAGGTISGFRMRMRKTVEKIQSGDILLCYLTGVMRWVGALRVLGPSTNTSKIWKVDDFPVRLEVETLMLLSRNMVCQCLNCKAELRSTAGRQIRENSKVS